MIKTKTIKSSSIGRYTKLIGSCIILQIVSGVALADSSERNNGVIDEQLPGTASLSSKELNKQVKKEQRELAKQNRNELKNKANNGERLAQVALGSDYASEAQMLTFAPAAANDALGDALRWYAVAAKRGFPGAASLDASGVSFYPVRVIRNK